MRNARILATGLVVAVAMTLVGCTTTSTSEARSDKIVAVGAENHYADVISQIGGKYVSVTAIMSNPNTDPHTFEASPSVAQALSQASLVVQNGLGYDDFMQTLEKASPKSGRTVITAQKVLGLPDSTPNPHLWYKPETMPAVAGAIAKALTQLQPNHADYFQQRLNAFTTSISVWKQQLADFAHAHPGVNVAVTEPVADYMLEAAGVNIKTPWSLQAAIMNDTDPSPQDSAAQDALLANKQVSVFLYNQQVTDSTTEHYLAIARAHGIPVVGVYETMPLGLTYQRWMHDQLDALTKAVTTGQSTERLSS